MRLGRIAFALALCCSLTTTASAAPKGTKAITAKKKPHHHHHIHGVVVSVHHDMAKGHGEIKVQVPHHHHKKTATSAAATATSKKKHHHHGIVTVHVNSATKFEKVIHSQGKVHRHKTLFADVHKGEHVRVALDGQHHHAHEVDIEIHQHNKKLTLATPLKKKLLPFKIKPTK